MPWRRWIDQNMPRREQILANRWLRPYRNHLSRSELWRFTRRSVPRGVALGILVGVLVPVAQTIFAVLLALPTRANVAVAALTTFITNPFTTPPLWFAAYELGRWMLKLDAVTPQLPVPKQAEGLVAQWADWLMSDVAPATATGLLTLAVVGAAVGYLAASFFWRVRIGRKWRRRGHGRQGQKRTG